MLRRTTYGNPRLPLVIFLHGFLGDGTDFEEVMKNLSDIFYCVSYDLPFHGLSSGFPSGKDPVQSVLSTLLPLRPHMFVAYSMGGRILLNLLPHLQFHKIVLLSVDFLPLGKEEKKQRKEAEKKQAEQLHKESFTTFLRNWYSQPLFKTLQKKEALYRHMMEKRHSQEPRALSKALAHFSPRVLTTDPYFFSGFSAPLLYLAGAEDSKYARRAHSLPSHVPGAEISLLPEASHALHVEAPKEVAEAIQQFEVYT